MKNKNLIRFAQSLSLLPVIVMNVPLTNFHNIYINTGITQNGLVQKLNNSSFDALAIDNQAENSEVQILEARESKAFVIDEYFLEHNMPLGGTGTKMVEEAEKNNIDWRLLPAIAVRESTGGKNDCKKVKNNAFGWGSCKIGFKSDEEAIEVVARNLGGNNPDTAHHYDNKTTKQILRAYNPPSVIRHYAEQVMAIMDDIGDAEIKTTNALASAINT